MIVYSWVKEALMLRSIGIDSGDHWLEPQPVCPGTYQARENARLGKQQEGTRGVLSKAAQKTTAFKFYWGGYLSIVGKFGILWGQTMLSEVLLTCESEQRALVGQKRKLEQRKQVSLTSQSWSNLMQIPEPWKGGQKLNTTKYNRCFVAEGIECGIWLSREEILVYIRSPIAQPDLYTCK